MQKSHFLLFKKLKNTESAQLCKMLELGRWAGAGTLGWSWMLELQRSVGSEQNTWSVDSEFDLSMRSTRSYRSRQKAVGEQRSISGFIHQRKLRKHQFNAINPFHPPGPFFAYYLN